MRKDRPDGCRVAILGLADDLGVRLNAGRAGAIDGPTAFRTALARYGVAQPHGFLWPGIFDAGDVVPAEGADEAALTETHRRVTDAVRAVLAMGLFPIGIGGGHDLTFPFVRAVIEHWKAAGVAVDHGVYFDAHLDVRETPGSGMAFRRLYEDCGVRDLRVVGFNPYTNAHEHVQWFLDHGGKGAAPSAMAFPERFHGADWFLSVDLDVLGSSVAPGVSAPNPDGMSVHDLAKALSYAARFEELRCVDFMELNPAFDADGRTARVAVHLFLTFLHGFAFRGVGVGGAS
ncbi:formiminoglutamase [Phycisphaerales bacterium]|nr:formiminoglutamase [Phycisphaerales bacterium]